MSANSSRIFCCSMPVRRCNCSSMMACACFSVNSKAAINESRASFGAFDARIRRIFVEIVESLLEAEQNVLALPRLAQLVFRAPADHFDAVIDEVADQIDQ